MTAAPFVAQFSMWRRALAALLSAGFVALGLWIAGVIGSIAQPNPVIGWLSVVTFGTFGLVGLARSRVRGVALRVDESGIWRWNASGGFLIPWHAIRAIDERDVHRQRFLCLHLADPDAYRVPGAVARVNEGMGFADVSIGVQATDRRFDDLLAAVEHFGAAAYRSEG